MSAHPVTAVEEPTPAPPPPPGALGGTRAAAVGFLVLLAVPFVAYVAGVRAPATENREPVAAPPVARVTGLDDEALAQLTEHFSDALPGRQVAVRADAWVDRRVFRQSPNPAVLLGEGDWLFLARSVVFPCRDDAQVAFLRAEIARATALVAATGRDIRLVAPPNKATVYPDLLGGSAGDAACGLAYSDQVRRMIEDDPPPGYVPLWDTIDELRDATPDPVYLRSDTHWTTEGSAAMVEAVVGSLDPSLLDGVELRAGREATYPGDLGRLVGLPTRITEQLLAFYRPGVDWTLSRPGEVAWLPDGLPPFDVSVLRATGDEVVPGRTTMIHDSFALSSRAQLAPFFAELVMVRKHPVSVGWVGDIVAASDTVVFEVVERSLWQTVVDDGLVAALAVALADDLPHTSVPVTPDADGWFRLDPDGFDVLTTPGLGGRPSRAPYHLELDGPDGEPVTLDRRPEVRSGAPLIFDLRGRADAGALRLRIVDAEGAPVRPEELTLVATP